MMMPPPLSKFAHENERDDDDDLRMIQVYNSAMQEISSDMAAWSWRRSRRYLLGFATEAQ